MIRRLIFENFWWKIFSLALSFGLWLALVGESKRQASVQAKVQFKNFPPDLEISSDPIDRIYLRVQGPADRLTDPALNTAAVVLDLASITNPGEKTFTLTSDNVALPQEVDLERVVPSQVRLRFEKRTSREVPVAPRFSGNPPEGYRVVSADAFPKAVQVTGPETHVARVSNAETDAIDLSAAVGNPSFRVSVFVPDAHVRVIGSPMVFVRVKLEKSTGGPAKAGN